MRISGGLPSIQQHSLNATMSMTMATTDSADLSLNEYKSAFQDKMNQLYIHPSQTGRNEVIDITDAAYERMRTDPAYEQKILDAIGKNWAVDFKGNIPEFSYTHIDDTYEKCYGYTQGMRENFAYTGATPTNSKAKDHAKRTRTLGASDPEYLEAFLQRMFESRQLQRRGAEQERTSAMVDHKVHAARSYEKHMSNDSSVPVATQEYKG